MDEAQIKRSRCRNLCFRYCINMHVRTVILYTCHIFPLKGFPTILFVSTARYVKEQLQASRLGSCRVQRSYATPELDDPDPTMNQYHGNSLTYQHNGLIPNSRMHNKTVKPRKKDSVMNVLIRITVKPNRLKYRISRRMMIVELRILLVWKAGNIWFSVIIW